MNENETPKYFMYRNKRIPEWWKWYLPNENNPYKKEDTLTLEKGCLCDYWQFILQTSIIIQGR